MGPRTVTLGARSSGGLGGGFAPSAQPSPAPSGHGRRIVGGRRLNMQGDVFYLWVLLGIEFVLTIALRHWSRNHHGG